MSLCRRLKIQKRLFNTYRRSRSETNDSLTVTGTTELAGGLTADGHGDHRMIMLLTLLGLRATAPVTITGAHHIRKSYPLFFRHLEALGANFDYLPTDVP